MSTLTVGELEALITRIVQTALQPQGAQNGSSDDAQMEKVHQELAKPFDPTAPSLADIALEIAARVPEEEWAKIPKDASKRYKEYLYGTVQNQE